MRRNNSTNSSVWVGRDDMPQGSDTRRWHHLVRPFTTTGEDYRGGGFVFIGYPTDAGIRANGGRPGALRGPGEIRRFLANLPASSRAGFVLRDAGDVKVGGLGVAEQQEALATRVAVVMTAGLTPIVLGGGHDLAYGHYLGISKGWSQRYGMQRHGKRGKPVCLGIVNFDAHFDLRPATYGPNSGTPFTQILDAAQKFGDAVSYLCVGIQPSANTTWLFKNAKRRGVEFVTAEDIGIAPGASVNLKLRRFIARHDAIYLTFCLDVIAAAFAPGVSAPSSAGLLPATAIALMQTVVASGKVIAFDIAELSPPFDQDHRTARLSAQLVFDFVTTTPTRSSR